MFRWIDFGHMAGLSATLAYWFVVGTVGVGVLIWRYRERFVQWRHLSPRDRADALLNLGIFGVLLNAALQRSIAAYSFAVQEWRLSPVTLTAAPLYLGWSLVAMAAVLWWVCFEIFGPARNRVWWAVFITSGLWLGAGVSWRY